MDKGITIIEGALWVLAWFGVMLFHTLLDVAVWRKAAPRRAGILNLITVALCMGGFLVLLKTKGRFELDLTYGVTLQGVLLALGCAVALYFLADPLGAALGNRIGPSIHPYGLRRLLYSGARGL